MKVQGAAKLIELTPRIMHLIRTEMRAVATQEIDTELTVPQFRILAHLSSKQLGPSELAAEIGTSLPGISRMVDGLVSRGLIKRGRSVRDRRQIRLSLSSRGRSLFEQIQERAQLRVAEKFSRFSEAESRQMLSTLQLLERLFGGESYEEEFNRNGLRTELTGIRELRA